MKTVEKVYEGWVNFTSNFKSSFWSIKTRQAFDENTARIMQKESGL